MTEIADRLQIVDQIIDRMGARNLLLGVRFQPKREDIATPQILLDAGFPEGSLRLVSFSAATARDLSKAADGDNIILGAFYMAQTMYWRADDQPVLSMTDVPTLVAQDFSLITKVSTVINKFLGFEDKAAEAAKNASSVQKAAAGPKTDGGGESPSSSDSTPQESVSDPSSTPTS
jgi:hypothetical protein